MENYNKIFLIQKKGWNLQIKLSNKIIILFEITLIFLSILTLYKISDNNQESYKATKNKLLMLQTADRLRQSSDDLTHFARTYVVTGDNKFKQQYYDTLNIRDGKKDRPLNYHSIYWDLDKNIRSINHKDTKKISLNSIFKSLPYDKQEIEKLKLSKLNSDDLVNLETEAFNAIDGIFKDINGNYNIKKQSNQALAIKLLHSTEYYNAKNKIMKPIDDFILMLDKRTTDNILEIHAQSKYIFLFLGFIILIFLIGNYLIFIFLNKQEQIKHDEKSNLLNKQKELSEQLLEKSKVTQKLNRELEERVKERTFQLKHANKAKSEFLANMSHEIRTPLNAILGFVDILKEESKGRKSSEYVDIIYKSSDTLLQIIEDILDFSKIESGKLNIDKVYFDPFDEFKIITNLFEGKCSQNDISLHLTLDKNIPPSIKTDSLRIKQIISNLLSNAIKFTPAKNSIFVDISYEKDILKVSVKDEGKGIAADKLKHIFEAFSQEDNSTTRFYGGTGLGLTISSNLVRLLGGELKVKSELGIGSEFYFYIPVEVGEKIHKESKTKNKPLFNNEKILVVEDNKSNQMLMTILLKKMKLSFEFANDGIEAIDMFKSSKYDAILMDKNMPNMNGIEATKHILQYEQENNLEHTPIIALTANALKGDRERFLEAGMDEYLTKPINKDRLGETLIKVL